MKVYNTKFLRGNQRLVVAILAGLGSALVCAIVYALLVLLIGFNSSLFYIGMAYGISYCVKTFGRGVDQKYCLIGALCTLLSIVVGDMLLVLIPLGMNLSFIPAAFISVLYSFLHISVSGIIDIICIAYALYLAYYNSRIV